MELTYLRAGDYLLPNLILRESSQNVQPLGRYALMHQQFLKEHRPILYNTLLLSEKLYPLLREIDETAQERRAQGVPESLILAELIYD